MIHSRRRRTGRWTLLSGIALVAVGVLSFNAYADFTGTTSFDQPASTGTMMLDKANEAIKAYNLPGPGEMAPGDTMQRGLLLSVSGTVSASSITLAAADAAPTVLDDGVGIDMQLRVDVCDQAWDETLHQSNTVPTYACAGNQHEVLGDTDLGDLIAGPATLDAAHLDLAGANHLRLTWTLPSAADNAFQDIDNTVSLTFAAQQRGATDK